LESMRSVGLIALIDMLVFLGATALGVRFTEAHLLSFCAAAVAGYALRVRGAAVAVGRGADPRLHIHLAIVAAFAVLLRGGVLGLLVNRWEVPTHLAILPAILLSVAITHWGGSFAVKSRAWMLDGDPKDSPMVWLVAAAFLLRLVYLGQVELLPEDAYYWNYSQHLAPGYLDHPPMVAWLIWLGTAVFGNTEFGVRIAALGCAALASVYAYRLTRNLFGGRSALVALVLMQALPFFFFGGMLMTPDAPLTAAWIAALYYLERALLGGQSRAWLIAGAAIGLGLLSKYTIAMLVPATLLFVILDPPSRRWLASWEPYAALLIAALIFSPVVFWNAQHEWASFAFQTSRRLAEAPRFALHKLILSMLVLLTPTGFLTVFVSGLVRARDAGAAERRRWLLLRMAVLVPICVFVAFSLRHDVKIDWTGAPWLAAVPALSAAIVRLGARPPSRWRWLHAAWTPTVVIMLLLYAAGLHYLALGLPGLGYGRKLELVPVGWRDLGGQVGDLARQVRRETGLEPVIVGMDRYELASELSFYVPGPPPAVRQRVTSRNLFGQNGLMYGPWAHTMELERRPLILVAWDVSDLSDELIAPYVEAGPVQEGYLARDGVRIREFRYRIARGWHGAVEP
jgi:dolichol-phosphate mannosyltransferase